MSTDLEARLERRLSATADAMPTMADGLGAVRSRGRRRRLVHQGVLAGGGLAAVVVVAALAVDALGPRAASTIAVDGGPGRADGSTGGGLVAPDDEPTAPTTTVADGAGEASSDGENGATPGPLVDPTSIDGNDNDGDGDGDEVGSTENTEEIIVDPSPTGTDLAAIDDLSYAGAFRLSSERFGASDANYAVGTLAYHPERRSLFVAGHAHHNAIAEFAVPDTLGTGSELSELPVVDQPRQAFTTVFDRIDNPDRIDRITGLYVVDGRLLVNGELWYDAAASARDTTLVIGDADDLDGAAVSGFHQMDGGAMAGGYMSPVPENWRAAVGGSAIGGWASNYSIISRYSVGPSLYGFSPETVAAAAPGPIATTEHMSFPHGGGRYLAPDALEQRQGGASPVWNMLSRGVYGFIIPGTSTFMVVGSSGGVDSGIGYKITQDDGTLCGGSCSYRADDNYNYYWLFDLRLILDADDPTEPRPYASGRWDVPFDDGGAHDIIGATFDPVGGRLYLSLSEAGQVGTYDRPPLIVVYNVG
ncbi:MAG: hypothetical protein AAGD35_01825 [Actinomycetota bacterium]